MNIIISAVLFMITLPVLAEAQCFGQGHMGGWGMLMIFFWIIVFAAIVYGIYAFGVNRGSSNGGQQTGKALNILKERYAKGEIAKEEYERIKKDIEG